MTGKKSEVKSQKSEAGDADAGHSSLITHYSSLLAWNRLTVAFLVVTTLARLALLLRMELVPDEAYYWDWSRHLALGYYDQGPMIGYVIRLTTILFGTNEFGVRVGVCIASLGTLMCACILARRFFGPLAGLLTVVLLGLTPLMAVGSLIATYDPLLVVFWALALVCLERALFASDPRTQNRAWLCAGLATGLGFLSKHTMLLILPCLVLFLILSPSHRFWLRRWQPYLAFLLTLLLYSGVFWWNIQHHGWTFGHLLFLAAKTNHTPLRRFGDFLGSQAALLGPGLFLACMGIAYRAARNGNRVAAFPEQQPHSKTGEASPYPLNPKPYSLFLLCLGLPVFLFFCLLTLKAKVQGNWAPCAWITPTILLAGMWARQIEMGGKTARRAWRNVAIVGALSGLLTVVMLSPDVRARLGIRLPPDSDLSNTAYGWRQMAIRADAIRREMAVTGRPVFLAGNDYQNCALLAFYLPDHPETHDLFLHNRLTMYAAYVEDLRKHLGEDALFVNDTQAEDTDLRQIFTSVEWDAAFPIRRSPYYTEPIRTMHFARCRGYRRYTGLKWARGG